MGKEVERRKEVGMEVRGDSGNTSALENHIIQ